MKIQLSYLAMMKLHKQTICFNYDVLVWTSDIVSFLVEHLLATEVYLKNLDSFSEFVNW